MYICMCVRMCVQSNLQGVMVVLHISYKIDCVSDDEINWSVSRGSEVVSTMDTAAFYMCL